MQAKKMRRNGVVEFWSNGVMGVVEDEPDFKERRFGNRRGRL